MFTTNLLATAARRHHVQRNQSDLMMAVVFVAIEGVRRAGVGNLDEPILTEEADAFKDW